MAEEGVGGGCWLFKVNTPRFFKIIVNQDDPIREGKLKIPEPFCEHVKEVYDQVELRAVGGKCWEVKIRRCSRATGQQLKFLGIGWGAFAAGNSLEVGDVY